LPSLLQNYTEDLHGELIGTVLEISATLQASKTAAVGNTAAATLQQLLLSIFEKVSSEDGLYPSPLIVLLDLSDKWTERATTAAVTTLSIDDNQIDVGPAAYDAYRVRSIASL
jgi:hypothetical protein